MAAQGKRIHAFCKLIWGEADYDIDLENERCESYWCIVKKDFGDSYGPPLIMTTSVCHTENAAFNELERMLRIKADKVKSGKPITKDDKLEIHGGRNGEFRDLLQKSSGGG
jgi:hypothetical protein